jgi:hypothetical protein
MNCPVATSSAQLPAWLSLCPSAKYVSLRRRSASVRLRREISALRLSASSFCRPANVATKVLTAIRTVKIVISRASSVGERAMLCVGASGSGKKIEACIAA